MSIIPIREVEAKLRKRHVADRVIDRIVKLNPEGIDEGAYPRGWHPRARYVAQVWREGLVSKRQFIATHGRAAWNALPDWDKRRDGRREYATWEALMDHQRRRKAA